MLTVVGLTVNYGQVSVLQDATLEVGDNEIVALIGANGAGKTTLLKTLAGLLKPRDGQINFAGKDISHLSPDRRVSLGFCLIPEGRHLFPSLTVYEHLILGAYTRRKEIMRNMELVYSLFPRLRERLNQRAGSLSGGEQQMLAIGRGLMSKPRLLLLDEPSLGLSPILVRDIYQAISGQLYQQGVSVLLAEQYGIIALRASSRGYVLERGKIIISGPSANLLENDNIKKSYLGIR